MLHNVLARQLPIDAPRVAGGAGRRRDRSAIAGRRPSSVDEWLRLQVALGPLPRTVAAAREAAGSRCGRRQPPPTAVSVTDPLRRLAPVVRLAPAKLNLTLAVIGRRADGYHDLHSVMVPLALGRPPERRRRPAGRPTRCTSRERTSGPLADNLVLRGIAEARRIAGPAATAIGSRAGARRPPREARSRVAAGLGGGSSDGAAALRRRARGVGRRPRRRSCSETPRLRLGSDVPFFLADGPALVEGRGERVTPLPALRGEVAGRPPRDAGPADLDGRRVPRVARPARAPPRRASRLASSRHLADEWRAGLDAQKLFERAGVLAPANDLLVATGSRGTGMPSWRGVRSPGSWAGRSASRAPAPPAGSSILRPTEAQPPRPTASREALATGELRLPGGGPPFVAATTITAASTSRPRRRGHRSIPLDDPNDDRPREAER